MRRVLVALLAALAVPVWMAAGAAAQDVDALVQELNFRGYVVEANADGDTRDGINGIEDLVDRFGSEPRVFFLSLAADVDAGPDLLADQLAAATEQPGTVFIRTPAEVGAASAVFDDADVDRATDAAVAAFDGGGDFVAMSRAFAEALPRSGGSTVGVDGSTTSGGGDGGGGAGSVLLVLLIIGVVIFGVVWFLRRRGKKTQTTVVEQAKAELRSDISKLGTDIYDLAERVDLADDPEAKRHFRTANDVFVDADEQLERATTYAAVDDLDDEVELAAWHLDAAEAILDGEPVPDKPDLEDPPPPPEPRPLPDRNGRPQYPEGDRRRVEPRRIPTRQRRSNRRSGGLLGGGGGGGGGLFGGGGGGGLGSVLGGALGSILVSGGGRGGGGLRPTPRSQPRRPSPRRPSQPRRQTRGRSRRRL